MGENLLESYNPLYDVHLRQYFALPHMQKHLRSLGLLDGSPVQQQNELHAGHLAMMDLMLRNRERVLQQLMDLQRKLDAAEKVELYRRIRSGITNADDSDIHQHMSRSLSRPARSAAARLGERRGRRQSLSPEANELIKRVESDYRSDSAPFKNPKSIYNRLAASVYKYQYLHKLDDRTLRKYMLSLRKQLAKLERFREVSFGPHTMAKHPPQQLQQSWFFRRRSLPSLNSANANQSRTHTQQTNAGGQRSLKSGLSHKSRSGKSQSPLKFANAIDEPPHKMQRRTSTSRTRQRLPPLPKKRSFAASRTNTLPTSKTAERLPPTASIKSVRKTPPDSRRAAPPSTAQKKTPTGSRPGSKGSTTPVPVQKQPSASAGGILPAIGGAIAAAGAVQLVLDDDGKKAEEGEGRESAAPSPSVSLAASQTTTTDGGQAGGDSEWEEQRKSSAKAAPEEISGGTETRPTPEAFLEKEIGKEEMENNESEESMETEGRMEEQQTTPAPTAAEEEEKEEGQRMEEEEDEQRMEEREEEEKRVEEEEEEKRREEREEEEKRMEEEEEEKRREEREEEEKRMEEEEEEKRREETFQREQAPSLAEEGRHGVEQSPLEEHVFVGQNLQENQGNGAEEEDGTTNSMDHPEEQVEEAEAKSVDHHEENEEEADASSLDHYQKHFKEADEEAKAKLFDQIEERVVESDENSVDHYEQKPVEADDRSLDHYEEHVREVIDKSVDHHEPNLGQADVSSFDHYEENVGEADGRLIDYEENVEESVDRSIERHEEKEDADKSLDSQEENVEEPGGRSIDHHEEKEDVDRSFDPQEEKVEESGGRSIDHHEEKEDIDKSLDPQEENVEEPGGRSLGHHEEHVGEADDKTFDHHKEKEAIAGSFEHHENVGEAVDRSLEKEHVDKSVESSVDHHKENLGKADAGSLDHHEENVGEADDRSFDHHEEHSEEAEATLFARPEEQLKGDKDERPRLTHPSEFLIENRSVENQAEQHEQGEVEYSAEEETREPLEEEQCPPDGCRLHRDDLVESEEISRKEDDLVRKLSKTERFSKEIEENTDANTNEDESISEKYILTEEEHQKANLEKGRESGLSEEGHLPKADVDNESMKSWMKQEEEGALNCYGKPDNGNGQTNEDKDRGDQSAEAEQKRQSHSIRENGGGAELDQDHKIEDEAQLEVEHVAGLGMRRHSSHHSFDENVISPRQSNEGTRPATAEAIHQGFEEPKRTDRLISQPSIQITSASEYGGSAECNLESVNKAQEEAHHFPGELEEMAGKQPFLGNGDEEKPKRVESEEGQHQQKDGEGMNGGVGGGEREEEGNKRWKKSNGHLTEEGASSDDTEGADEDGSDGDDGSVIIRNQCQKSEGEEQTQQPFKLEADSEHK